HRLKSARVSLARPSIAATNGTTDVVSANGPQAAPKRASFFLSTSGMPTSDKSRIEPQRESEARSPFGGMCAAAHSAKDQNSGWRVTLRKPAAALFGSMRASPRTLTAFGRVRAKTKSMLANDSTTMWIQRDHGAGAHSST